MKLKLVITTLFIAALSITNANAIDEHQAKGNIQAIDYNSKLISISHGAIKSAGMAAMTMSFKIADPSMLDEIKVGDTIDFTFTTDSRGRFVVLDLQ